MQLAALLETARMFAGGGVAVAGLAAMAAGTLGGLRFPDFYTRLHAASAGLLLGPPLVLLGLALLAADIATALRLVLLAALIAGVRPLMLHLAANAAHAAGLSPVTGKYVAPRPGRRP
jgi:multicomponent Na+:H+ antiporter subunit G